MNKIHFAFFILLLVSCTSEKKAPQEKELGKPLVISVNYPLHYFAQRIGGDLIRAEFPLPNDIDPAFWKPKAEAVHRFQKANLILDNGADYAKWMKQVSLPQSKILNTSSEFTEALLREARGVSHSHGPEGEHSHGELAFTIWLNFRLAIRQAEAIRTSLMKIMPEQEELLETNFKSLSSDLKSLDLQISEIALNFKGRTLLASHPVYQYLGNGYDFGVDSKHWEPDQMPEPEDLESFQDKLAELNNPVMLWEAEPLPKMRQWLEEIGVEIVVFEPCGNEPNDGDFLTVMKRNLENLKMATADMKPVVEQP